MKSNFQYVPKEKRESAKPTKSATPSATKKAARLEDLVFTSGFVDSHVHIDFVLERLKYQLSEFKGLKSERFGPLFKGCINVGCFVSTFDAQEQLIGEEGLYSTFGVHPHDAGKYTDAIEQRIMKNMKAPTVVAWGECGLDNFKCPVPTNVQQEVFVRQMKGAISVNKPLVVHSRDASADTYRLMTETLPSDWKIHLHCFTGDDEEFAQNMLRAFPNLNIGFTGAITFKSAQKTREIVSRVPLDRILLETDGPFMAPEPYRGEHAHPGHIPLVGNCVASLHGVSLDEVLQKTFENTNKIYGCFK